VAQNPTCRYHDGVCYIIDVAQAVPVTHRSAPDLLAADCDAVTQFFQDRGCGVLPYAELVAMILAGDGAGSGSVDGE
jgi:serine/threonine-protein kinase RIO1